jgi:diacylglycerol kinase (ATP)
MPRDVRAARKLGKLTARLAKRAAAYDRKEEARAYSLAVRSAEARLLDPLAEAKPATTLDLPRRRALLIINSKSGPRRDSMLRTREIVDTLATFNIRADVRIKLSKKQARGEARAAAKAGYPLVIAAGGDGTVESVAWGLVDTDAALGIIPLGTYNNVATCLGIPENVPEACALIAGGSPRAIDAGQVKVAGKKARMFFETCAVGVGAPLTAVGQAAEKGRWDTARRALPSVLGMPPSGTQIRLDGGPPRWTQTLLITVSNAPRAGASFQLAPAARMDDGLLDICVFEGLQQADLAARVLALKNGDIVEDPRVQYARAISVRVRSSRPLPVAADSKLIGTTPARFVVRPGAVLAIVGHGPGLSLPAPELLADVVAEVAPVASNGASGTESLAELPPPLPRPVSSALASARAVAVPVATALALQALPAIARALSRRFGRR